MSLATQFVAQMLNNFAVFRLRAEKYDFSIRSDLHRVTWRPIKEVSSCHGFFPSIRVGNRNLTF